MGSPLIQFCQDAQIELGLPLSTAIIRAQDNTGRQFGGLANRLGRLLIRMHDWTILTSEWHITIPAPVLLTASSQAGSPVLIITAPQPWPSSLTVGRMTVSGPGLMTATRLLAVDGVNGNVTLDQPCTMTTMDTYFFRFDNPAQPTDWERAINRTQWDRSMRWELRGPQSPQSDQWVRSGIVATGPRRMYREINGGFRFWPAPASDDAGSQMITEYISNNWVRDASGNPKPRFNADTDTCIYDDDVMTTGLKYLFFAVKGFDVSSLLPQWQQVTQQAIAADGPSATLDMDRTRFPIFISPSNVQDADFPGSFGNR